MNLKYQIKLIVLAGLLILTSLLMVSCGTEEAKPITIGVINLAPSLEPLYENFRTQMAELGFTEGENINYIYGGPAASIADLDTIAQEFVEADVDLILAMTTPASQAVARATTDIPIIFAPVNDPIGSGLVDNLIHPGKNITGVTFGSQEEKRLEWFLRVAPEIKRIYIPYNPNDDSSTTALGNVSAAASRFGAEIVQVPVQDGDQVAAAIENIPDGVDAIYLLPDSLVMGRVSEFITKARELGLPTSVPETDTVPGGGLMSYGMSLDAIGKQAARLANQVLQNGINPGELPVENAEFFLVINLKTAQDLGLEIPDEILRQADIIIR